MNNTLPVKRVEDVGSEAIIAVTNSDDDHSQGLQQDSAQHGQYITPILSHRYRSV